MNELIQDTFNYYMNNTYNKDMYESYISELYSDIAVIQEQEVDDEYVIVEEKQYTFDEFENEFNSTLAETKLYLLLSCKTKHKYNKVMKQYYEYALSVRQGHIVDIPTLERILSRI